MSETRRRHTKEFKIEAIRLAEGSRKGPGAVARELGITPELLRRWKRELQAAESEADAFPGVRGPGNRKKAKESSGNNSKSSKTAAKSSKINKVISQDEEIRRLRRENARLREEREILKKAAAFFARESR